MYIKSWSEIDVKAPSYYERIIALCNQGRVLPKNIKFIVVDHCLPTFESHVTSLTPLGEVVGVILKSSTRDKKAEDFAKKHCKVLEITKEDLKKPGFANEVILKNTSNTDKIIILDHGGYFASGISKLVGDAEIQKRLLGIVEVTENGHAKYEKELINAKVPLLSVARTELKELADIQAGVSICDATNTLMYSVHAALNSLQNACVIGYGKIGRSIANTCRKRGIPEVTVIELDPIRALVAREEGHNVVMADDIEVRKTALQRAQVLFSATGKNALSKSDIPYLRSLDKNHKGIFQGVIFIASCTSPDDEFNPNFFTELEALSSNGREEREESEETNKLSPYKLFDGRQINILNGGKAVNFAIGGNPGYQICQVWASILYSAVKLAAKEVEPAHAVQTISRNEQVAICKITEEVFFPKIKKGEPVKLQRSLSFSSLSMFLEAPNKHSYKLENNDKDTTNRKKYESIV